MNQLSKGPTHGRSHGGDVPRWSERLGPTQATPAPKVERVPPKEFDMRGSGSSQRPLGESHCGVVTRRTSALLPRGDEWGDIQSPEGRVGLSPYIENAVRQLEWSQ